VSYTTEDFAESLIRVTPPLDVEEVMAAWGYGDGQGEDAGHCRWADNGATDWYGGFLLRLADGTFAYLTGWCDYTGWGCQDGIEIRRFATEPTYDELKASSSDYAPAPEWAEWDIQPADLNRWLRNRDVEDHQ
jgi:hypothetical protein